jgi:hypothetical protein
VTGRQLPPDDPWARPDGVDDATVEAVGTATEALERLERARGALYEFHQQTGRADLLFGEAADQLEQAGHPAWADRIRSEVVGRNVLDGRWSFQVVEEFNRGHYEPVRDVERALCGDLTGGVRHLYEAEMKEARRTHGDPLQASRPASPPA